MTEESATTERADIERSDTSVLVSMRDPGTLTDTVSASIREDGKVVLSIAMGIDETTPEGNADFGWPTEGFAEVVIPAEAWEALRTLGL